MKRITMVGPFPPPLHGMAAVNAAVRERLRAAGAETLEIDLAPSSLGRSLSSKLGRLPRVIRGLWRLSSARDLSGKVLYMSVSGGLGQVYEIVFLLLARLRRMRVYLHHHSFAYLDTRRILATFLGIIAGPRATHLALSRKMMERLQELYPAVRKAVWISNASLMLAPIDPAPEPRRQLKTLGFLGNITEEKGIFDFLALMRAMEFHRIPVCAKLAGPFQAAKTEQDVLEDVTRLDHVEYVGAIYGEDKDDFYAGIDALAFPTRYANEAEPLTIHEAMRLGLPVIAFGRGCIPEVLSSDSGLVIAPEESFVALALQQVEAWISSPSTLERASRAAPKRFRHSFEASLHCWDSLLSEMLAE